MKPAKILIVDDNPTNLKLAGDLLAFEGYEVTRIQDALQVLPSLAQAVPDLILMDIQMPGIDGLTLTKRIKTDFAEQKIRIVAMTAFAMRGDEEKALAVGCDAYITKPIDTRNFPAQIATILSKEIL